MGFSFTAKQRRWLDITAVIIFTATSIVGFSEYFNHNGGILTLIAAILFGFMAIVKLLILIVERKKT